MMPPRLAVACDMRYALRVEFNMGSAIAEVARTIATTIIDSIKLTPA